MLNRINLVVAHKLEARPLVDLFQLQQVSNDPLVYGDRTGLCLIVSGEGSAASEAAVRYLGQSDEFPATAAWLNVGIAGHQTLTIGESLLINKVVRRRDGAAYYPVLPASQLPSGELHTVDEPEFAFPDNVAYDMEAFGFYSAAQEFATLELVQCFKIISDNAAQDASTVSVQRVLEVIEHNHAAIKQLVTDLLSLQQRYEEFAGDPEGWRELASGMHLTATQQIQVRRLMQRYRAFGMQEELDKLLSEKSDARGLVQRLRAGLVEEIG